MPRTENKSNRLFRLFLVTSRQHFTLPGLVAKSLDTLRPEEARDPVLRISPRPK